MRVVDEILGRARHQTMAALGGVEAVGCDVELAGECSLPDDRPEPPGYPYPVSAAQETLEGGQERGGGLAEDIQTRLPEASATDASVASIMHNMSWVSQTAASHDTTPRAGGRPRALLPGTAVARGLAAITQEEGAVCAMRLRRPAPLAGWSGGRIRSARRPHRRQSWPGPAPSSLNAPRLMRPTAVRRCARARL